MPSYEISRKRSFDFSSLAAAGSLSQRMPMRIPVPRYSVGTLEVRVHSANVDGNSDGSVAVRVRSSGRTAQDPSQAFSGPTLALVTAADANTTGPRYATQGFYADGDLLEVAVEGQQDSGSGGLDLDATVSLSVRLDDADVLPPTAIFQSTLKTWWDGAYATRSSWHDRIGGRTANATAGEEPVLGQINGHQGPGYVSPGSAVDGYVNSSAKDWFKFLHDGTGGTLAIATRALSAGASKYIFDEIRAAASRTGISAIYNGSDGLEIRVGNSSGTFLVQTSVDVSATILKPHFLIFRLDTSQSTDWDFFVDQGATPDQSGNVTGTPDTGDATLSPRLLARASGASTSALDGYCGEIIIADTFASDLQVAQLGRYLKAKYL